MARVAIAVQDLAANAGATITLAAADATDNMKFLNDGETILIIKNAGAGAVSVTVVSVAEPQFGRTGNIILSVAAAAEGIFNRLAPIGYNQKSGADQDNVQVDFDIDTSVTVGAVKLKK